jgi:hypothetical protein
MIGGDFPQQGRPLVRLVLLRHSSGSRSIPTTHKIQNKNTMPHGICSTHTNRILWARTTDSGCNSYWHNHSHWPDDPDGRRQQPHKSKRVREVPPSTAEMIKGYSKADPPTKKMLPVEADVLELQVEMGYGSSGLSQILAIGDLSLIAFYYLLQIGEYTVKGKCQLKTNSTVQT